MTINVRLRIRTDVNRRRASTQGGGVRVEASHDVVDREEHLARSRGHTTVPKTGTLETARADIETVVSAGTFVATGRVHVETH